MRSRPQKGTSLEVHVLLKESVIFESEAHESYLFKLGRQQACPAFGAKLQQLFGLKSIPATLGDLGDLVRERWSKNLREQTVERVLPKDLLRYRYQTQVEIPVTTADFYFPPEHRPLLLFVDGRVHLGTAQMAKDEELRSLLRKRGYRILELGYDSYSDRKRDQLYEAIRDNLAQLAP